MSAVLFTLDSLRLGIPLAAVERVVPAVEITPLPGAPEPVAGVFNLQGQVVPVLDLRRRFRLPQRATIPEDHVVIVHSAGRLLGVLVDEAQDVVDFDLETITRPDLVVEGFEHIQGIVRLKDGLLMINDPERFLDLHGSRMLANALEAADAAL